MNVRIFKEGRVEENENSEKQFLEQAQKKGFFFLTRQKKKGKENKRKFLAISKTFVVQPLASVKGQVWSCSRLGAVNLGIGDHGCCLKEH